MLPLAEVGAEVLPGRLGDVEGGVNCDDRGRVLDVVTSLEERVDVGRSLLDVALDVERVARTFGQPGSTKGVSRRRQQPGLRWTYVRRK